MIPCQALRRGHHSQFMVTDAKPPAISNEAAGEIRSFQFVLQNAQFGTREPLITDGVARAICGEREHSWLPDWAAGREAA